MGLRYRVLPGVSERTDASGERIEAHYRASPLALGINKNRLAGSDIIKEQQWGEAGYVRAVYDMNMNKNNQ